MPYKKCDLPPYPCKEDMWDRLSAEKRPIVVYGMGNGADKLIKRFEKYNIEISDFFASDGFVRGHSFHGKRVKSFSEIKAEYADFVIVLSFASNRPEVLEMLKCIDSEYCMYIPDMPVADESEYFDREFYNSHYNEIVKAYGRLADDASRNAFAAIVSYKLTGKMEYLEGAYSAKEEKYSLLPCDKIGVYVDAGAYNGDTFFEALDSFPNLTLSHLIEPDARNFKKLLKNLEKAGQTEINALNAAVWCECCEAEFSSGGNRNSSVNSTRSYENRTSLVRAITVDSVAGSGADFIKYDVEGAEYEALVGSAEVIEKYTPSLLVSLYHRSKDIFFLINYLFDRYGGGYKFYLRRQRCVPAWEIDLLLIPTP